MPIPELEDLREWIRSYTPYLLGVAQAFAEGADEAEDILQEVWIVAYQKAHQRPDGTPIGAWLHTVTLNIGRSRLRRLRRRMRLRAHWAGDLKPRGHAEEAAGIGVALARSQLWRAIARLPKLQQETILLRIVEDMSTREAAEALGRAEGTVKASLHRALRTLREDLRQGAGEAAELEGLEG